MCYWTTVYIKIDRRIAVKRKSADDYVGHPNNKRSKHNCKLNKTRTLDSRHVLSDQP